MPGQSSPPTKAQLDKSEREHLENVVTELRNNVEADIEYQLEHAYELNQEDGGKDLSGDRAGTRTDLVKAVEREDENKSWEEKFERYVMGVGYTIVNRLTALRCMEVRGFIDRPVTKFGDSGTTPAAEKLENEQYLAPDEAKIKAYDDACRKLTDEIEILFDAESPYSIIHPDVDTFEELCRKLDDVPDEVWRADDVLGWVYEYYNASKLDELRRKGDRKGLDPEDVPPANQFYTPHWVVRMLTDNSLTKMYLESKGELLSTIEDQQGLSTEERKFRDVSPDETPSLADFSTYLVPTKNEGEAPDFESVKDIRVIDPACGSGHFLLYAFDILERIWHHERPDLDRGEIPKQILRHNLYGIDLDLRACQLAAFNLYLKARSRSEEEGKSDFEMPDVGIVCADTRIANVEAAAQVFDEVAGDQPDVREALEDILGAFENIQGLGSLLDVKGTLEDEFINKEQPTITESITEPGSLSKFLQKLHNAVSEHHSGESFLAQDLKSFLRVLVILSQDYDVTLMNPPYGSRNRMPKVVKDYVKSHYEYNPEFYINFFEVCDALTKQSGRVGMLVPRTFMFKKSFEDFRVDFVGDRGAFDFLAEFGIGILDNATVRTVGTVVRTGRDNSNSEGEFIRLHDVEKGNKERVFLESSFEQSVDSDGIRRKYARELSEFQKIPGAPISYWVPSNVRELYETDVLFDDGNAKAGRESLGVVNQGIATGDNGRFVRSHWETVDDGWVPFAMGGEDAWILPNITNTINWKDNGKEVRRYEGGNGTPNEQYYFTEGLTYTYIKEGGRRFGHLHQDSIFSHTGFVFIPEHSIWHLLSYTNSNLVNYLMLAQTTGRHWNAGEVSKLPWYDELGKIDILETYAKEMVEHMMCFRQRDPSSPYYQGPLLLRMLGTEESLPGKVHPHRDLLEHVSATSPKKILDPSASIEQISIQGEKYLCKIRGLLETKSRKIDLELFNHFNLPEDQRKEILLEVALRTNDDPRKIPEHDPEQITDTPENLGELVKNLIHHFALNILDEDDDGIVPLEFEPSSESSLLDRLEDEFERIFGDYSEERMAEVDRILGDKAPNNGAYPNLQRWIKNDLFEYHLKNFENTPILWQITTERLTSDSQKEGFTALVDYRQLDASIFDRVESRYLEPLKSEYRNRRNTADQRRSNTSLSTTEQAAAAEQFEQYESRLAQINGFQEAALSLSSTQPREIDEETQVKFVELIPLVVEFRERTEARLDTLDQLVDEMDPEEFEDLFSPTFLDRVNENRDEWINALRDLESACIAYSDDADKPVEAHLYDLFPYLDDLVGTTHYGSNGIFFMNYYFSKGEKYLDDGEPRDGLEGEVRLLAELAAETDEDVEIGMQIKESCNELSKAISSDWQERALSEILTAGYDPVKKHGVALNIRPLAEKRIVPEIVEDKVVN